MSVKYMDNTTRVRFDVDRNTSLAIRYMLDAAHDHARPKTPRDKNRLAQDVLKTVQGTRGTIVWLKQYAAAQETGRIKGRTIRNYTTPGTGAHFAENAVRYVVGRSQSFLNKARLI